MSATAQTLDEAAPTRLLINGRWQDSSDAAEISVLDPSSGVPMANVASATETDARAAVAAADAAGPTWAGTSPRERGEILRRAFTLMTDRAEELARIVVRENGKALSDAQAEIAYAAEFFRWYAEEAVRIDGHLQMAPCGANRILVLRQPIGVCVLVTPWNFPAAMATRKIGPALAAGCTVVLKPASETPLTALAIGALLAEAGVPHGVVNVLPAHRSASIVRTLLQQTPVRKLSFTGSTEVGRLLLAQASERVLSCSMELGGNAPFLVLADADLDAAVAGALIAKMRNGGEACTAANRFYVHSAVAEEFARRLAQAMSTLVVGPGLEPGVQVGPLVNQAAVTKVEELVSDAVDRGAAVRTGGKAPQGPGFFYEPTVIDQVPADAQLLREEIFGPVAPIVAFDDLDAAIAQANNTEYGLASYVYTSDLAAGLRTAEALHAGMVGLNRGVVSDPAAPFGGTKQSGLGREGGHAGLLEFTESKYVATQW
jgi:succinate-semialdehyde dehydrogenase/glutarate-semialdehyde dehydrogenase